MGTAEGIAAADVTFEMYNNSFNNLSVVYMSTINGVSETMIPRWSSMPIIASLGSMVAFVDQGFYGDTIDLAPDNGEYIAQVWRTQNITLFVAGAETDGMYIDVNIT